MDDLKDLPEFGIKRENEERRDGGMGFVFDPASQKYAMGLQRNGSLRVFAGGIDDNEDLIQGILREVMEESGLYDFGHVENLGSVVAHYHNSLRNVNRVTKSTSLLVILNSAKLKPAQLEDHEIFELAWVTADEMMSNLKEYNQNQDNDHLLYLFPLAAKRAIELGYDKTTTSDTLN
jgi:8-oxo-dGTP pyrophosphatase MutT (NUDIX family)